jgi:hypothetical protein
VQLTKPVALTSRLTWFRLPSCARSTASCGIGKGGKKTDSARLRLQPLQVSPGLSRSLQPSPALSRPV